MGWEFLREGGCPSTGSGRTGESLCTHRRVFARGGEFSGIGLAEWAVASADTWVCPYGGLGGFGRIRQSRYRGRDRTVGWDFRPFGCAQGDMVYGLASVGLLWFEFGARWPRGNKVIAMGVAALSGSFVIRVRGGFETRPYGGWVSFGYCLLMVGVVPGGGLHGGGSFDRLRTNGGR